MNKYYLQIFTVCLVAHSLVSRELLVFNEKQEKMTIYHLPEDVLDEHVMLVMLVKRAEKWFPKHFRWSL